MRVRAALIGTVACLTLAETVRGDSCGPVEVVVARVGDGVTPLSTSAFPVALVKYSEAGSLQATFPLPTAADEDHPYPLTIEGGSTVTPLLSRSSDGRYLLIAGFAAIPGTAMPAGTPATGIFRTIGRVDATGAVDTSTALNDLADMNSPRSATSTDGNALWAAGGSGGVRYAVLGATSSTALAGTAVRQVSIFENQLYLSSSTVSGTVATVGVGLPTTAGQSLADLPGLPADGGAVGYAFVDLSPSIAGVDTLYVAHSSAGIQKWTFDGNSWSADGTAGFGGDAYRGLAATVELGVVKIFATRNASQLVTVEDSSGYDGTLAGSPSILSVAPVHTRFAGVAMAPLAEPVGIHCDDFESEDFAGWSSSAP